MILLLMEEDVQRRQDGSVSFDKNWIDYEEGFGSLTGEFWYRLRPLHCLTNQGQWKLRIDFTFTNGTKSYVSYNNFAVGSANSQYQLSISGFTGITSDPFSIHSLNGTKFSTKDRDNDQHGVHCASFNGAWWHNSCTNIRLNHPNKNYNSMYLDKQHNMDFIEMKIKPFQC